jgi:PAS domain S-box-containing protein
MASGFARMDLVLRTHMGFAMTDQDKSKQEVIDELVEREAQLLEAQEVANLGFYVVDLATGRCTTSSVLDRVFGIPFDYPKTLDTWAALIHPGDRQEIQDYLKEVVGEKKPFDCEYRIIRYGDQQMRWLHGLGRLQFSAEGQPVSMLGTVQDITERKQAEEELQKAHDELEQRVKERTVELAKANEELRAIHDGMPDGLIITDIETQHFVRVNSAICQMLGYTEAELRSLSVGDLHPAEALPYIVERLCAVEYDRLHISRTIPVLRKDGSTLYAEVIGNFLIYNGKPSAMGIFRDISERKRAQEALAKEHRNLKHLLHASDHERQLIAYDIHDGLAQQLAGAIMQIQTFTHLKDKSPKEAAKALDAGLTMLQQGHFEARRLIAGVRPPILDEAGIAEAISHLVHEESRDKGPKIEFHSRVAFDRMDPTLENAIYRIAQEGLTNACKHSKSERISVSLLQQEDRLRVEIRDWGIGFETRAVPKNHFGLEGIRQRARLLGGKCSIKSRQAKGTLIRVELPVVRRDVEEKRR